MSLRSLLRFTQASRWSYNGLGTVLVPTYHVGQRVLPEIWDSVLDLTLFL